MSTPGTSGSQALAATASGSAGASQVQAAGASRPFTRARAAMASGSSAPASNSAAADSRDFGRKHDKAKMSFDSLLIDLPQKFLCSSCGNLVIPDHALQAACGELICGDCTPYMESCIEHSSHAFKKSIIGSALTKEIGKVMVRCVWQKEGCRWIGTVSDHSIHKATCPWTWNLSESQHEVQSAKDPTISTKVMAEKYKNAYFLWSWRGKMVNDAPVLSDIRVQAEGMCAFVSITAAFEACLRLKGHKVKALSITQLFKDFLKAKQGPNAFSGTLNILATILKDKGMVELPSNGEPPKRWYISKFKMFKMETRDGMLEAVNHIHDNDPVVCVHAVTQYQSDYMQSWGIIHGPSIIDVLDYSRVYESTRGMQTHAVCSVGIGAEDMTSFFSYQNTVGVNVQKDGYGRLLSSSVLEALGLFIAEDEDCGRPLKRPKLLYNRSVGC